MKHLTCSFLFLTVFSTVIFAQISMVDTTIISSDEVTINGARVPYTTSVGNQPVFNNDGEVVATLFYTYYKRSDIKNTEKRPLVFSFNGGPGSASVWMHLGYTGPKQLIIDDEGYPVQPYGFRDNPHSILDVADIVFVNPVNVAFSRMIDDEQDRDYFFGVNADVKYLADWIDTFVSRNGRWPSPKYLIGESYGTTRVSGLAHRLQNSHWMFLNGVILVSPTGLGIDRDGPVGAATNLPYFAATAWYHNTLKPEYQEKDLDEFLPEVEAYAIDTFLPALAKGGFLDETERRAIANQVGAYSGIDPEQVLNQNLEMPTSFFWKELLRDEGYTIGRLDSRYRGVDEKNAGDRYDHDPALTAWNHAFAPAINHYLREELGYETDLRYWVFGPVRPWDRGGDLTGEQLREAMAQNPYLHVMVQSGYYDGGTNYFDAKYTMWNMDKSGKLKDRLSFKGYRSGHMMYLRKEDLATSNQDIRDFILKSIPAEGEEARH
ncbi:MAG: carboxypeptidase [Bacteroidota bacterium]